MIYHLNILRHRLAISVNRRRGRPPKSFTAHLHNYIQQLIKLAKDKRYSGNPLSRVFRRIFEDKRARKALGVNLMAIVFLAGIVTPSASAFTTNSGVEITNTSSNITSLITENSVRLPLDSFQITQNYHLFHLGVDLAEPLGTPVYPIMDGEVESISYDRFSYGNHLIINHGSGLKSLYGHFSKINVKEDQKVDRNTIIGLVGSTGFSSGPHLHLEIIDNGQKINPFSVLVFPKTGVSLSAAPK